MSGHNAAPAVRVDGVEYHEADGVSSVLSAADATEGTCGLCRRCLSVTVSKCPDARSQINHVGVARATRYWTEHQAINAELWETITPH